MTAASLVAVTLLALLPQPAPATTTSAEEPMVIVVGDASGPIEISRDGLRWLPASAGQKLREGEAFRTGAASEATLCLPLGARVRLGGTSRLALRSGALALEAGHLEVRAPQPFSMAFPGGDLSGAGVVVLRADVAVVALSVLEGAFSLRAGEKRLRLGAREGALVPDKALVKGPLALLAPPEDLDPGIDPVYVRLGSPFQASFKDTGGPYRVTLEKNVGGAPFREVVAERPPVSIALEELGLYRWRVRRVDPRGLEAVASADGHVCVVRR